MSALAPPDSLIRQAPPAERLPGSLRILCISKPKRHQSAQLAISRDTYCQVEDAFRLSKSTIASLFNSSGVFARFTEYDEITRKPRYIRLVVKSKQKVNVGNWEVSLTHNIETGCTDVLICAEGIFTLSRPDHSSTETQVQKFVEHLSSVPNLWSHPLIVPTLLIRLFCERISVNRLKVADKLVDLENEMGVTTAGRSKAKRSLDNWPHDLDIKQITINLNSTGASILYLSQTCAWTQDCIGYLIKLCDEMGQTHNSMWLESMEIKETLEYESSALQGVGMTMRTKKERIQAQLNVLFSAASQKENAIALGYSRMAQEQNEIAQKDVQLNTRIATSTKSDSIAMTTFTFITAVFLPGSYVASLMSINMFDWMSTTTEDGKLSSLFWLYWVVTIPLSAVVLLGWWLWYKKVRQRLHMICIALIVIMNRQINSGRKIRAFDSMGMHCPRFGGVAAMSVKSRRARESRKWYQMTRNTTLAPFTILCDTVRLCEDVVAPPDPCILDLLVS